MADKMANEKLIRASDARGAVLKADPKLVYCIDNIKPVDAVEVVHGRWLINSDGYYPYCSKCKNEPKGGEMTNYCPNCGVKMDLED